MMTTGPLTRRHVLLALGSSAALIPSRAIGQARSEIVLRYTFQEETHSWLPGLSDYMLDATELRFRAEVRKLPPNFQSDLRAYYIQCHNTPDDLFMFLKKELGSSDGIEPDRAYSVSIHIGFLSNAPAGLAGIGGSPGESVVLKAGVSLLEPVAILDTEHQYVRLNLDKGHQIEGGRDLQVVSTIENGQAPQQNQPYVYLERVHHVPSVIRTDRRGVLWVTVGTESGFEGLTGLYFYQIIVTLRPQ